MTEYFIACRSNEILQGEPRCFELPNGTRIALFKIDDEIYAIDDKCTHGSASLSEGWQEAGVIECPFHGGSFNIRTGQPVSFPCVEPVRTYEVKLDGDTVAIRLPSA
jgi:nitrite reductase/ring-hydroxylating ferredoxin subunit